MGLPIAAIAGLAGGLLGGGGADAQKYAERKARVAALQGLAAQGNVDAWAYLGAIGKVAPLPRAVSLPIPNGTAPAGWTSKDWGDAYQPIQFSAARAYANLATSFAAAGVPGAQAVSGTQPVLTLIPSVQPMNGPAPAGAKPAGFSLDAIPWWVLAAAAVLLVLFLMR